MNNTYPRILPIGSIVKIKKILEPIMIINNTQKDCDYLGVNHPYGYENYQKIIKFNIDDIEKYYFIGYINKEIEIDLTKKNTKLIIGGKKNE